MTPTHFEQAFYNEVIAAGGSATFEIDLERIDPEGIMSLEIEVATAGGNGNVDVVWQASNSGDNWITPSGTADIFTAFDASSGPNSDGKDIASFNPPICRKLRIVATEQGGVNPITITAWLAVQ